MEVKRSFKGVWIPREIWLADDLNITEKAFLAEIDSLSTTKYGCFANNKHFSKFSGLSASRCSTIINDLERKGYVNIDLIRKQGTKEIEKRYIKLNYSSSSYVEEGISQMKGGYFGNDEGINTKDINTSNKDIVVSKETTKDNIPYQEIIDYFNKINKKNLKNVPSHQKFIRARWKEGYRLNDFKTVIDNKFLTWKGTEWEKYLRPSTLFGTKFDEYLNEINHNPINNNQKGVLNEYSKLKPKD